jgi:hypothetical protein
MDAGIVESVPEQQLVAETPELLPRVEALITLQWAPQSKVIRDIPELGAALIRVPENRMLVLAKALSLEMNVTYAGPNYVMRIDNNSIHSHRPTISVAVHPADD